MMSGAGPTTFRVFEIQPFSACLFYVLPWALCFALRLTWNEPMKRPLSFADRYLAGFACMSVLDCLTRPHWWTILVWLSFLPPWNDWLRRLRKKLSALRSSMTAVAQAALRRQIQQTFAARALSPARW